MTSTISEFLMDEWRQTFHFFDINKDGKLTRDDFESLADRLSMTTNASEEEAIRTRKECVKYIHYLQPDPSIVVDESRYLATSKEVYQDVEEFKRLERDTASDMFDRIYLNKNGEISLDEFQLFYEACGKLNREVTIETFQKVDTDGDGFIQREEFIDDFVRFFTDPDPVTGQAYILAMPLTQ